MTSQPRIVTPRAVKQAVPRPPTHLSEATKRWWRAIASTYALEPHHIRTLTLAGESWDRKEQAREAIRREGLLVADRFGVLRANPAASIERDCRIAFLRAVRELALDVVDPPQSRPPTHWRS